MASDDGMRCNETLDTPAEIDVRAGDVVDYLKTTPPLELARRLHGWSLLPVDYRCWHGSAELASCASVTTYRNSVCLRVTTGRCEACGITKYFPLSLSSDPTRRNPPTISGVREESTRLPPDVVVDLILHAAKRRRALERVLHSVLDDKDVVDMVSYAMRE
jgi:hypothetical protein